MSDGALSALLVRIAPHIGIGFVVIIAALGLALKIQTTRLDHAREALKIEQAVHETDIANFRAAQALANADWQAELARVQTNNRRNNDEADRQADAARTDYLDRVMRLPSAGADSGLSGGGQMPGSGAAESPHGPGGDTVFLARADAAICATNTARLEAAVDWGNAFSEGR